ncbi:S-adenosyl-L-methionine-dependent methyltransferases superfamily protein [Tanacetum coccineum]
MVATIVGADGAGESYRMMSQSYGFLDSVVMLILFNLRPVENNNGFLGFMLLAAAVSSKNHGLPRFPKWGHLKELHRAIKLCEHALLNNKPTLVHLGSKQEVGFRSVFRLYPTESTTISLFQDKIPICSLSLLRLIDAIGFSQKYSFLKLSHGMDGVLFINADVFEDESGTCAAFIANLDDKTEKTVQFRNVSYTLPAWSVSILPDCKNVVFNTAKMLHGVIAVTVAVMIVPLYTRYPPVVGVAWATETQFDMRPHMESDRWPLIYATIQQHLQKIYNGKKVALKEKHWIPDSDETYNLERIRQSRPSHISEDELLRLQGLGSNTETGVPYTEDEITAIVRGGKQRGHIPGVGRFLPGQGTIIPPSPPCKHSSDVAKLKKRDKVLTCEVNMFMKLFRSDDKFSQMLSQLESQPEIGGDSRSGGCGDVARETPPPWQIFV